MEIFRFHIHQVQKSNTNNKHKILYKFLKYNYKKLNQFLLNINPVYIGNTKQLILKNLKSHINNLKKEIM